MDNVNQETVQFVINEGLCNGCGTCTAICPSESIEIEVSPTGLLRAHVNLNSCVNCGQCLLVCSGTHIAPNLINPQADPFSGTPITCYRGFANDKQVRDGGQSGGIATALLSYLLESGVSSNTLVVGSDPMTLRPVPMLCDSESQLSATQSSKYCPVALNSLLRRIHEFDRTAYVGLPCHVRGLHNFLHQGIKTEGKPLVIGLFCDSVLSFRTIEFLISKSSVEREDISSFRFKDKRFGRYPGNCVLGAAGGRNYFVPNSERMFIKSITKPPFCYLCHDKLNMHADVSLGDTWGIDTSKKGLSVVICWTDRGRELIENAQKMKYISIEPVEIKNIYKGQCIETRKAVWASSMEIWRHKGKFVPAFGPKLNEDELAAMQDKKAQDMFKDALRLFASRDSEEFERRFTRRVRDKSRFRHISQIANIISKAYKKIISWNH